MKFQPMKTWSIFWDQLPAKNPRQNYPFHIWKVSDSCSFWPYFEVEVKKWTGMNLNLRI